MAARWHYAIRRGLDGMQGGGGLERDADVDDLAITLLTTLQGGLVLAKTLRDERPLGTALNTVIDHIASFAAA